MCAQHTTALAGRKGAGLDLAKPQKALTETPTGSEHRLACEHAGKEGVACRGPVNYLWARIGCM